MAIGVSIRLYNGATAQANVTGITALWWDEAVPADFDFPIGKMTTASTDADGDIELDLSDVSSLTTGQDGFLLLRKLDGTDHKDSPIFAGKITTSNVTGAAKMPYNNGWVRPTTWPVLSDVSGGQKVSGLYAVYPRGPNWAAFTFTCSDSSQYTVDWGDNQSNSNVNSNSAAEHSYSYGNCSDNDIGIANAIACTFSDTGDTVNLTAHPFKNGEMVEFSTITSTTGISVGTIYYVVNSAANTFQVADTVGGSAKTLTTDGSGNVYIPIYRIAVIDIWPTTGGKTFLTANFNVRHSGASSGSAVDYTTGWLDMAVHASAMTSCIFNGSGINCYNSILEQFVSYAFGTITTGYSYMFARCRNLQSVSLPSTASGTNFSYMFFGNFRLKAIPLLDTSSGTNLNSMFSSCSSLRRVPLLNTASCNNFGLMFSDCTYLPTIPLLDTGLGTDFSSMFSGCFSLLTIPLLDTSAGTNFSSMFANCFSLQSLPFLNTSSGTNFSSMLSDCRTLQVIPLLNTSAGTNFGTMFNNCYSLQIGALSGTAQNITYPAGQLSGAELNAIYTGLATVTAKTITVTGNYGVANDDPTIATNKGWTVIS